MEFYKFDTCLTHVGTFSSNTQPDVNSLLSPAVCVHYELSSCSHSCVLLCFIWTLLSTYSNFRSSSPPFKVVVLIHQVVWQWAVLALKVWNGRLQSYPPLPGETWIIPMSPSPSAPAPKHCTTNSAETTNIIRTASVSLRKAHDTLSITDAKSPQQAVLMCSLSARRRERSLRVIIPLHTHAHTHFPPFSSYSSFSTSRIAFINTYSWWHNAPCTHARAHRGNLFLICTLFPPKCNLCWGCCKKWAK